MSATMVVADSRKDVDPKVWTPAHAAIIKAAAEDPLVERIFVNAAIKKKLCEGAGTDRAWLTKVRPYWEHDYHFHVRIKCPDDSPNCKHQDPVPAGDGCGKDLDWWFTDAVLHPKPSTEPEKPRPPIKMADLPQAAGRCWRRREDHAGGPKSGASASSRARPRPASRPPRRRRAFGRRRIRIGSLPDRIDPVQPHDDQESSRGR